MKHFIPLMATLVASTLAAPMMAQDMSSFLNPRALAANLGLDGNIAAMRGPEDVIRVPSGYALNNTRIVTPSDLGSFAALTPDVSLLAPRTSMAPIPRRSVTGTIARILPEASGATAMSEVMTEARANAPLGANVAVISGANTAVINGEVIRSEAAPVSSPRPTFWQRIFGL